MIVFSVLFVSAGDNNSPLLLTRTCPSYDCTGTICVLSEVISALFDTVVELNTDMFA